MDPRKVLYITYYWPPSGGAGVQRSLKMARYLPEFGIEPIILTVDAEAATYPVEDPSLLEEVPGGLRVIRTGSFEPLQVLSRMVGGKSKVPYGGFANKDKERWTQKVLRFVRGNFFLPDARKGWVRYALREAARLIREERIDTVVVSSPPHSSQLIGLALKRSVPGIRWIADLRDPWTDIYYYSDLLHTPLARAIDRRLERRVLERCDHALVVSADIRRIFSGKSENVDAKKIHVIPNGFDPVDFDPSVRPPEDIFRITYVGTMAERYRPEVFFRIVAELRKAGTVRPLRLRFVGSTRSAAEPLLERYGLRDIAEFIGHVPHREATRYMQDSNALLLVIPEVEHARGILTGKLFEYLGAARPVIALGPNDGDAAAILEETGAGRMFGREQSEALGAFLRELVEAPLAVSEKVNAAERYSRRTLAGALARIILAD
jgi:glycosyltransferase involved in cell wall biosynthesis